MVLKSILSLQVLNINDEEPVFIETMERILGRAGGRGGDVQVDILRRFLDARCATLRALRSPHIFQTAHPQQ